MSSTGTYLLAILDNKRIFSEIFDQAKSIVDSKIKTKNALVKPLMFVHKIYKPFAGMAIEYQTIKSIEQPIWGETLTFVLRHFGDFMHDMGIRIHVVQDPRSNRNQNPGDEFLYQFRWCDYPGERLIRETRLKKDGYNISKYNVRDTVFLRNVMSQNRLSSYLPSVGMSEQEFTFMQPNRIPPGTYDTAADMYPLGPRFPTDTEYQFVVSNQQHYLDDTQDLDVVVPLLFWFCNNFDQALAYPTQYETVLTLEIDLIQNFYDILGNGLASNQPFGYDPYIETCELYVCNLFVPKELVDLYIMRTTYTVFRNYKGETIDLPAATHGTASIKLSNVKRFIESFLIGAQPTDIGTSTNTDGDYAPMINWHHYQNYTNASYTALDFWGINMYPTDTSYDVFQYTKLIEYLSVEADNVELYSWNSDLFYSQYLPYVSDTPGPRDKGILYVPFSLIWGNPLGDDRYTSAPLSGYLNGYLIKDIFLNLQYSCPTDAKLRVLSITLNQTTVDGKDFVNRYTW